jgi:5-methylcytosine-specific restriction endonuclease McrA
MPFAPPKHRPPGWKPGPKKTTNPFYNSVFWKHLRQRVRQRDGGICQVCGKSDSRRVDHVKPREEGGADHEWNLRTLCDDCDAKRHAEKGHAWR